MEFGPGPGEEVFAASFLARREIVFASELLDHAPALVEIFAHEIYHFAWRRLGNVERAAWAQLLQGETKPKHAGLSSRLRYEEFIERRADRRWKNYVCEAFCDTAGAMTQPKSKISSQRKQWFKRLLKRRKLAV